MKITVLIKEVPDTWGRRTLHLETGIADRAASDPVMDEVCERALEVALSYADEADCEVVALSMAPASAEPTIRKALAMGADAAVHVVDEALVGADMGLTAEVLAAAVRRNGSDLVIAGNSSTDGGGGMLAAMVAEHLGVPHLTQLRSVEIAEDAVSGQRVGDGALVALSAALPAVISVTEHLPEARFPDMRSTMAAKKKLLERLSLDDLGIRVDPASTARSIMTAVSERPSRGAGIKLVDEGDAGRRLAEFLIENRLAEGTRA